MKKLLLLPAAALIISLAACENEPENPGDFNVRSELRVGELRSLVTGDVYPLKVARETDTVYQYSYEVNDTAKDAQGNPLLRPDGQLDITTETRWYDSKKTAHFVEYEPVYLPSFVSVPVDTFELSLYSNANWLAPAPSASVTWFKNINSTTGGGGDGVVNFTVNQFLNEISRHVAEQVLLTKDSLEMVRIYIRHTGLKYQGN